MDFPGSGVVGDGLGNVGAGGVDGGEGAGGEGSFFGATVLALGFSGGEPLACGFCLLGSLRGGFREVVAFFFFAMASGL